MDKTCRICGGKWEKIYEGGCCAACTSNLAEYRDDQLRRNYEEAIRKKIDNASQTLP
jgi:hypothetical protein